MPGLMPRMLPNVLHALMLCSRAQEVQACLWSPDSAQQEHCTVCDCPLNCLLHKSCHPHAVLIWAERSLLHPCLCMGARCCVMVPWLLPFCHLPAVFVVRARCDQLCVWQEMDREPEQLPTPQALTNGDAEFHQEALQLSPLQTEGMMKSSMKPSDLQGKLGTANCP